MPAVISKPTVDDLPAELLSMVLSSAHISDVQSNAIAAKFRFTLASVCRKWRAITCSSASIWSDLTITLDTDSAYLALIFDRSKSAPLSIMLHLNPYNYSCGRIPGTTYIEGGLTVHNLCAVTLPMIKAQAPRIAELRMRCGSQLLLDEVLAVLKPLDGQALKVLDLEVPLVMFRELCWHPADSSRIMSLFGGESAIRELRLVSLPLINAGLQFTAVTHLNLDGVPWPLSWSSFVRNLSAMSNLQALGLAGIVCSDYDLDTPTPLPMVTDLHITITTAGCDYPLKLLLFPSLSTCRLWLVIGDLPSVVEALTDALANIQHLELFDHGNNTSLTDVLSHTSNLESLDLSRVDLDVYRKVVRLLKSNQLVLNFLKHVDIGGFLNCEAETTNFLWGTTASLTMPCLDDVSSKELWSMGKDGRFECRKFISL
ncbi:hypothetical protein C8F04DRAFT_1261419 [Mycena alexandri]|uniref:F-box domain-containing protein n=1 Tax=Mycena alexandri TaxID=1745969 RepID=A0AAD6SSW8_9AGAR|nr:hypothetical protein C8F04DRAFT_1261419 [Mycena alexandri]